MECAGVRQLANRLPLRHRAHAVIVCVDEPGKNQAFGKLDTLRAGGRILADAADVLAFDHHPAVALDPLAFLVVYPHPLRVQRGALVVGHDSRSHSSPA